MSKHRPPSLFCLNCHYHGPVTKRGSILIELILYCFYIVPGFIYSCWRAGGGKCPSCRGSNLIPADSPRAMAIRSGGEVVPLKEPGGKNAA